VIVERSEPVTLVGGAQLGPDDLSITTALAPTVVAADSGADHLLAADIAPTAIFGDLDSISDAARAKYADVLHQINEQDTTDLSKSLRYIQAPVVLGVGFIGDRIDHTFAALHSALAHIDRPIVFLGSDDVVFVLKDREVSLAVPTQTPLAVLPLIESVVSSEGLKWELDQTVLSMVGIISSSNQTISAPARISVRGAVAVTLPRDQLRAAIDAVRAG